MYDHWVQQTMTVSEARAALPEILDRVLAGDEVTITRHGKPVAVVVRPDALRTRRADDVFAAAHRLHEMLAAARARPLPAEGSISPERGEELLAELRTNRAKG